MVRNERLEKGPAEPMQKFNEEEWLTHICICYGWVHGWVDLFEPRKMGRETGGKTSTLFIPQLVQ
jgi:hypothetical protein